MGFTYEKNIKYIKVIYKPIYKHTSYIVYIVVHVLSSLIIDI